MKPVFMAMNLFGCGFCLALAMVMSDRDNVFGFWISFASFLCNGLFGALQLYQITRGVDPKNTFPT